MKRVFCISWIGFLSTEMLITIDLLTCPWRTILLINHWAHENHCSYITPKADSSTKRRGTVLLENITLLKCPNLEATFYSVRKEGRACYIFLQHLIFWAPHVQFTFPSKLFEQSVAPLSPLPFQQELIIAAEMQFSFYRSPRNFFSQSLPKLTLTSV
jgi:hypothetical protein